MTRATFFKHFELLADQPDALAKMRELVLELAVRGKLVSNGTQADKDGAWTKFCAEATALKSELSPAFNVPSHWRWARLEDVAAPCGQKKPDASFTYVEVGAIDNERGVIKDDVEVVEPENAPSRARKLVAQNSVIYSTVRPYLKNIAIVDRKFSPSAIVSTAFAVLHPMDFLQSRYLYHWLRSRPFQSDVESKMKGVAYPAINDSELWQCLIPVPPPAEQRRIVAKVDELMSLCDELEQRQQARQHASGLLQQSALHHLLAAREPQTFAAAWQRVRDHFHLLHDTPDALPQLRQAILQLAVQGRLVPQNPKDEPVSEQLREIEKARSLFVQKGLMRKSDALPDVEADEMPYQIPSNWKWVRVGTVGMTQTGSTPPTANRDFFGDFIPFVKPADLTEREINYGGEGISESGVKQSTLIPADSVLMVCIGGSIGKTNLNTRDVCCNQQINALTPFSKTESRYIMSCMKAAWFQEQVKRDAGQTTLPIISKGKWERLPFPLPPLAEQKRIVARVEELLRWCDTLEAQLNQTRTLGAHLLASTLHHLLAA